jgi:CheY-like chemotaxis protein/anti-sigma regulatory factor (Ser/Thr protein kinase)
MPPTDTILVVDDSAVDLAITTAYVRAAGFEPVTATDGRAALAVVEANRPALVLTDLQMPDMDGLELVRCLAAEYPTVPVVLVTAHGSERIAVEALRSGASHYVPKRSLKRDLPRAIATVLEAAAAATERARVRTLLDHHEARFILENDRRAARVLVGYLQECLARLTGLESTERIQVGTALTEALDNAIDHGNLELDSSLRETSFAHYHEEAEARRARAPYAERKVWVAVRFAPGRAEFVVRDDGPGFDVASLPDPRDPENILRASGRGVLLIRTFMDEVVFNARGNEITMVKRTD